MPKKPQQRQEDLERALEVLREEFRHATEEWLDHERFLEENLARYKLLYDESPVAFLTLDEAGIVTDANTAAATLLCEEPRIVAGRPLVAFVERPFVNTVLRHVLRCRTGAPEVASDFTLRRRDAEGVPVHALSRRKHLPGAPPTYHTVLTETTDRLAAERALRESERRYREIVETAGEGICIVDREQRITFVNAPFASMFGGEATDFVGAQAASLLADGETDSTDAQSRLLEALTSGADIQLRRLDGTLLWASISTSVVRDQHGDVTGALHMITDVSARKELESTRESLVRRLVAAQEAERRRVARELHDQLGQHITGLSLGLNHLRQVSTPEVAASVRKMQELVDRMSRDAHHLALELRPAALDDLGLSAAVSNYADDVAQRSSLEVDVHCEVTARLDPTVETTVYRIVQEALTNIVKHAHAKHVSIIVDRQDSTLRLVVEDDGVGFHAERYLHYGSPDRRLGLAGMIERASLVGGELEIESSPGNGATLYLRVPLIQKDRTSHEEASSATRR